MVLDRHDNQPIQQELNLGNPDVNRGISSFQNRTDNLLEPTLCNYCQHNSVINGYCNNCQGNETENLLTSRSNQEEIEHLENLAASDLITEINHLDKIFEDVDIEDIKTVQIKVDNVKRKGIKFNSYGYEFGIIKYGNSKLYYINGVIFSRNKLNNELNNKLTSLLFNYSKKNSLSINKKIKNKSNLNKTREIELGRTNKGQKIIFLHYSDSITKDSAKISIKVGDMKYRISNIKYNFIQGTFIEVDSRDNVSILNEDELIYEEKKLGSKKYKIINDKDFKHTLLGLSLKCILDNNPHK